MRNLFPCVGFLRPLAEKESAPSPREMLAFDLQTMEVFSEIQRGQLGAVQSINPVL